MKRDWLLYLVMFSLALNLGIIGTLAYWHYQEGQTEAAREALPPMALRELWHRLDLEPEQRQTIRRCLPPHRRQIREIRRDLGQKRHELFDLIKESPGEWPTIEAKLREVNALQGKLEQEMVRFLLEVQSQLKPEQRQVLVEGLERRFLRVHGGRGPGGGPPGPHPGNHRGPGPGCPPGFREAPR